MDDFLKEMFKDYVEKSGDTNRHTKEACKEVEEYNELCDLVTDDNMLRIKLSDKMMDVAVEFEESGFIAGAKYMYLLFCSKMKMERSSDKTQ